MSETISKEEFKEKLDSGEYILIDVRTQQEHDMAKIAESEVFDVYRPDFVEKIGQLDKNKKYLIYCATGNRSRQVLDFMIGEGFKYVFDLAGGIYNYK